MLEKLKKPEIVVPAKPKFMISGESGVGKTFFALDFKKPVFIDAENGGNRPQYQEKLKKSGGVYFGREDGASDIREVTKLIKELNTTENEYQTIIIDSFSHLYMLECAEAEAKGGSDFGRDKKLANIPTRQLISTLEKCDKTVILICHSKQEWSRQGKDIVNIGTTFDGYDRLQYILDLWVELMKGSRTFMVRKSRIESLPQGSSFPLSYDRFSELYGKEVMEAPSKPVVMARADQVSRVKVLVEALKVPEEQIEKWFTKCSVDSFEEMSEIQITGCIGMLEKKILELGVKK